MPRRDDLRKILIIGSGPIIIGQACEFDYSGTQACKALRKLGYEIVLVNSNPATIMTDPAMADVTYIEPLNVASLTEIIAKERPDALLPNLGGQTGLNLSSALAGEGVLEKYGVRVIGVNIDAIKRGEDRQEFKNTMARLGIEVPRSDIATSYEDAVRVVKEIGLPVVIRPAYTMGGTGGGFAYNMEEFQTIAARGLSVSPVSQILVEESVLGWEELELEVVRDARGQKITVCFIENVDAMGVHTGDSYCTAPMLTIAPQLQERLQKYSYDIVDAIEVIGGTNIQFAHDPKTGRIVVIEINPRTSRSSALASKATGFPIAFVSSLLACGLTLDEIPYWRDGSLEKYTPSGDYVVVKFSRWAFEKFKGVQDRLGTQMRAVGEVMSIGKTYKEALQKAIRSLEIGRYGLGFAKDFHAKPLEALMEMLAEATSERQFIMYEAIRKGAATEALHRKTHIKAWFIEQMRELVQLEERILEHRGQLPPDDLFIQAKKDGFADRYLAKLLGVTEKEVRDRRTALGIVEAWDAVPVSGAENAAYYYSTYNAPDRVKTSSGRKILVLGGGPNRIGQGIEFDYCCVHAAFAIREEGMESIMINCNPETVSTDYDTSNKLYFEPLTLEDVLAIYEKEKPEGVIVQFGGQTPLNLAAELEAAGVKIIGTSPATIDLAEDRDRFRKIITRLGIPQAESGMASTFEEAISIAKAIGYPLMVRPSYVLGGRAMEKGARRGDAPGISGQGRGDLPREADPDRPFPGKRHRGRGRRHLGRDRCLRPGGDGAYRAGRRPFRRLGVRDPAGQHSPPAHRHHRGIHAEDRGGVRRGGADERPVRDRERDRVHPGGQPPGEPDRPSREQGLQHLDGAAGHPGHAREEAQGAGARPPAHPALRGEGGGVPVQHVPGSRPDPRAGDALDRRGAGDGGELRGGVLQGAAGGRAGPAAVGNGPHHGP